MGILPHSRLVKLATACCLLPLFAAAAAAVIAHHASRNHHGFLRRPEILSVLAVPASVWLQHVNLRVFVHFSDMCLVLPSTAFAALSGALALLDGRLVQRVVEGSGRACSVHMFP